MLRPRGLGLRHLELCRKARFVEGFRRVVRPACACLGACAGGGALLIVGVIRGCWGVGRLCGLRIPALGYHLMDLTSVVCSCILVEIVPAANVQLYFGSRLSPRVAARPLWNCSS